MKLYRVCYQEKTYWAQEENQDTLRLLKEAPFATINPSETRVTKNEVRVLAPSTPSKIVAVGRNYAGHAKELGNEVPKKPLLFLKPPSAILAPQEPILLPVQSKRVEHEAELAVIIARRAKMISPEESKSYLLGYTCANDVTARDLQRSDIQFTRGKGFDTFCPLGPCIDTQLNDMPRNISCHVNEKERQNGSTEQMVFHIETLVSYISHIMTLEPGDVILTGTPEGVGPLLHEDTVSITIDGIGTLTNPVLSLQ